MRTDPVLLAEGLANVLSTAQKEVRRLSEVVVGEKFRGTMEWGFPDAVLLPEHLGPLLADINNDDPEPVMLNGAKLHRVCTERKAYDIDALRIKDARWWASLWDSFALQLVEQIKQEQGKVPWSCVYGVSAPEVCCKIDGFTVFVYVNCMVALQEPAT
jgi:hypothetical protein